MGEIWARITLSLSSGNKRSGNDNLFSLRMPGKWYGDARSARSKTLLGGVQIKSYPGGVCSGFVEKIFDSLI
jgi:hypothetical protein